MQKINVVGAVFMAVAASGCATITRGSTQAFTVESTPPGAQVTTSMGHKCTATPCTFEKIKRDSSFTVTVSKSGYTPSTHNVTHQTAGGGAAGMAGNVLLGGLIGAAVDANSGATQELVPNPLRVTLETEPAPAPEPEPEPAKVAAAEPAPAEPPAADSGAPSPAAVR